jgi:hypothetical protein
MGDGTNRVRRVARGFLVYAIIILVTAGASEIVLRIRDPFTLRILLSEKNLSYRYDAELGWFPIPNSVTQVTATRTIEARHNSLGLRDVELGETSKSSILFLGDSFVWGYDVEADERFTDILQRDLPKKRIVNAGISGYGTDQEYLLLKRLWDRIRPSVVVLVFCTNNDRLDNSTNQRYFGYYKPYYVIAPDGSGEFKGYPVPISKNYSVNNSWVAKNVLLARLAFLVYFAVAHPEVQVPDPTEHLIGMMKQFVEAHGAKFVVGLQHPDPPLEASLRAQGIRYTSFEGASHYPENGEHWTPEGHVQIAARLSKFLAETGILSMDEASR